MMGDNQPYTSFIPRLPSRLGPGIVGNYHPQQQPPVFDMDRTVSAPATPSTWDTALPPSAMTWPDHSEPSEYDEYTPPRKKRAQVRIACTHCQKACKKCSNTRPCERCVKYGLKDCIDSVRKPRKTGVKRGPYKRRSTEGCSAPPPSFFDNAFISALQGETWSNGQRSDRVNDQVLYPPTPVVPFPISLNGRDDPFSRAVSPIHGAALPHALRKSPFDSPFEAFSDPFAPQAPPTPVYSISAPTSPRQRERPELRSQSTEPVVPPNQRLYDPMVPSMTPHALQSPDIVALSRIRKPSLRTLMSHGGSLAGSRQVSSVQSPTLFDQPLVWEEM
ncbi:hypothetical protein BD324DRAFT_507557 [Kockovaella imperatae]|uniref:Transcription activator of gluconeogenesis ERT1 n=1 Tax=Kockovaella imperatae TaxID=4999 RepID=A0A1Y1UFM1_9TREE|nr:hypothetical protein BD324DRAFT_507557 [Kockovaella imperatae]ORX35865.1 hypothetical protein BD324DRAFT_507557 [Kockovaella imperatae]